MYHHPPKHSSAEMMRRSLPQPNDDGPRYKYITYDELPMQFPHLYLGSRQPDDPSSTNTFYSSTFQYDTLVWVLVSKGRKIKQCDEATRGPVELFQRARVLQLLCESAESHHKNISPANKTQQRVLVQYPLGSTYRVRCSLLIPVLEPQRVYPRLVIVVDETPEYRRTAVVHTCVGDSFLEIGCDFGTCTDKVREALENIPDSPSLRTREDSTINKNKHSDDDRVFCMGIDKSSTSIQIATQRYPRTFFSLDDALTIEGTKQLRSRCRTHLIGSYPTVVAIDINGNRDIKDVINCLAQVIQPCGDDVILGTNWELPRLIIVKSRFLYQAMKD